MDKQIFIWKRESAPSGEPKRSNLSKSKSQKVKKSKERPSDVDSWRTYDSPADAINDAVAGAGDKADAQDLNADVAQIRRENPGISSYAAHVEAARGYVAKADGRDTSVHELADSLVSLHSEARRADMTPSQRQVFVKASRKVEETYLRAARPWASEPTAGQPAVDGDALVRKADSIRKADPNISAYEALLAARKV